MANMSLATTAILIVISIVIGFLIGALVYGLRGKPAATDQQLTHAEQGVRLWRDAEDQKLSIEVDGKACVQVTDLTPEERSRLVKVARDWLLWLGVPASRLAALVAPSNQESTLPPQPVQTAVGPGSTVQPPVVLTPSIPVTVAERGKTAPAQHSIAAQIDAILQARIANGPLAERGVRLQDVPEGMVVVVDAERYTDLSLVPDAEVREAIAAAVAEWEAKNAP